jgi:hypothetical protein
MSLLSKFIKIYQNLSKFIKIYQNLSKFIKIYQNLSNLSNLSKIVKIYQRIFQNLSKNYQNIFKFAKSSSKFMKNSSISKKFNFRKLSNFCFYFRLLPDTHAPNWFHSLKPFFLHYWLNKLECMSHAIFSKCQCYKTFYSRNLRMTVISVYPRQAFPA